MARETGGGGSSSSSEQLNLKVVGQDGQVIQFKIKQSTPFRKLMNAYCDRQKLALSTIRFVFDGTRLKESDTPKSMDMEEGDAIEVFTQQTGGSVHSDFVYKDRHSSFFASHH